MKISNLLRVLAALLTLSAMSAATNLKGSVKNGTTGKPVAGDDVVLLDMLQGMTEAARTKSDAQGHFSFNYAETGGPHMVRVLHEGVNYFPQGGIIPPGTSAAEVTVYDAAAKVQGIGLTVDMLRAQSEGSNLQVTELWVVKNTSSPPRTQMSDNAFELMLPPDAQVDSSMASGPGGQPLNSAPVPQSEKNKYAFIFPLRPGETRFQVSYHLPYSGKIKFGPRPLYATDHVVVMLPKSMQFAGGGAGYQTMEGGDPNANIQVITNVNPGQDLSFNLSGTGTIQEGQQTVTAGGGGGGQGGGMAQRRGGPGGGLGAPEETPDPLHRYRGYILGVLAVALALGVFYVVTRPKPAMASGAFVSQQPAPAVTTTKRAEPKQAAVPPQPPVDARTVAEVPPRNGGRLLDALKEELFHLEMERHQGKISAEEYEKAKAALDTTLARAAKRASS